MWTEVQQYRTSFLLNGVIIMALMKTSYNSHPWPGQMSTLRQNIVIPVKAFLSEGIILSQRKVNVNFSWIADTSHILWDIKEARNTSLLSWNCRLTITIFFFMYYTIRRDNYAFFVSKEQEKKLPSVTM